MTRKHNPSSKKTNAQAIDVKTAWQNIPVYQNDIMSIYILGIRDGLQIAADIRKKTRQAGEDAR